MFKSMVLCFILIMSILNIIKEIGRFYFAFKDNNKYESKTSRTVLTMASLSYIITIIIFGL